MSASTPASRENLVEIVHWLQTRCGEGTPIVVDTLLAASELLGFMSASFLAAFAKAETSDAVVWLSRDSIWHALEGVKKVMVNTAAAEPAASPAECRLCRSDSPLSVVHLNRSGSMAEGFHDLSFGSGGSSDYDIMLQLDAGCRWMADPMVEAGTEPPLISPESAPQLWAGRTDSPGFVKLYWARTSQCSHIVPSLALTPGSIRRLMRNVMVYVAGEDSISCPGPAVNVDYPRPELKDGGLDHVPCLRLPWWPDKQGFLNRRRTADFPPAAARHDICRYGVHLVPTGRHGSRTELSEWRLSFSRAEVVAAHYLSAEQRATVKAVKRMKVLLKEAGEEPALKSYYMKTAVFWLVQDEPSHRWRSVTDAVYMLLDWLERHLIAGRLPCFFWDGLNLLWSLKQEEVEDMLRTVRLMRSQAIQLLLTWCADKFGRQLQVALGDGPGPLSERHLRLGLARALITEGVSLGVVLRPAAPCWYHWGQCFISPLVRRSDSRLLQWRYRHSSADYHRQCLLLQAMLVAPADLVAGVRMTSHDRDLYTWDVTPLMALLKESDLDVFLGDRAAVSAWWCRQLCRPPAERPAGLTAGLETPQGRAELLLQPELLLRAVGEAATRATVIYRNSDEHLSLCWKIEYPIAEDYPSLRKSIQDQLDLPVARWQSILREFPPRDNGSTKAAVRFLLRCRLRHLLFGGRLGRKYDAVRTRPADNWQLRQFVVQENPTEDSSQGDERDASDGERWSLQKQEERKRDQQQEYQHHLSAQKQCCSYIKRWDDLVWHHHQEKECQAHHHRQEQEELKRRHLQAQEQKEEGRHRQELKELRLRHGQEREELRRQHLQQLDKYDELTWAMSEQFVIEDDVSSSPS